MQTTKNLHGQWALSLGVIGLGVFFLLGALQIPDAAGYSTVGPRAMPLFVGIALCGCGVMLCWEVWRGGFRQIDEVALQAMPSNWRAFLWLSAGLIVYGLLIERAGFIVASIILFACVARAFGSKRWRLNIAIAVMLAAMIYTIFTMGLGLNLPKGILRGLL